MYISRLELYAMFQPRGASVAIYATPPRSGARRHSPQFNLIIIPRKKRNDMTPYYGVDGQAEAAADIMPASALPQNSYNV